MRDEHITSAVNPTIRFARSLHRKRVRYRERALLVEGTRAIATAVEQGVWLRALLIDAKRAEEVDPALLQRLSRAAERVLRVDSMLFRSVAETEQPQGLIAICDMPERSIPHDASFVIALDAVRDPGNLGTLLRTAAAAAADGVALLPGCVDPYNAKAIRASAGAIFVVPVASFASLGAVVQSCFEQLPLVIAAATGAATAYDEVDMTGPVVLVVGSEASGISDESRTYAAGLVQIPMTPAIESLNAAVAGSIIAFDIARQRRQNP